VTFNVCAERYIDAHTASWHSAKHRLQWQATLANYAGPVIGNLSVQAIETAHVMKVLESLWSKRPETASRLRGRIEAVLEWARARGYRTGDNPARWRGHLQSLLPARLKARDVKHFAALPYGDLPGFMMELRNQNSISAAALEFAILTAARTGEVIGATWGEFDLRNMTWIVPAARMKARREHRVPLSAGAVKILEKMRPLGGEYVFPGKRSGKPLSNMALLMVLRRLRRGDLTAHGFRSTFRDWCAEQTDYPAEVAEMALAHTVSDKVEAAYRRGDMFDKRLRLAEEWNRYCSSSAVRPDLSPVKTNAFAET
jgi:integrase